MLVDVATLLVNITLFMLDETIETEFILEKNCDDASEMMEGSGMSTTTNIIIAEPSSTDVATSTTGVATPSSPPTGLIPEFSLVFYIAVFGPVVGFLVVCIFIALCCICCCTCAKKKNSSGAMYIEDPQEIIHPIYIHKEEEEFESDEEKDNVLIPISIWKPLPWGPVSSLPLHIQTMVRTLNIDRRKLSVTHTFLQGQRGCFSRGLLTMDCINPASDLNYGATLKMLTSLGERGRREDITRFIEKATLMQGLEHPNVLPVLGMSLEDCCIPIILYPIVEYGNMHNFIELYRVSPQDSPLNPYTARLKVNFGYQVACAMKFLSDKGIVHHDLALRNCWLDTNFIVKLSDGALTQEFYPQCYSMIRGALRPVKWSALETLQEGLLTTYSNVWSFGVVLWEIFKEADPPYLEVPDRAILSHLMMGERLQCPEGCPESVYSLMKKCWLHRAEERPNFACLLAILKGLDMQYSTIQHPYSIPSSPDMSKSHIDVQGSQTLEFPSDTYQSRTSNQSTATLTGSKGTAPYKMSHLSVGKQVSQTDRVSLTFSVLSGSVSGSESEEEGNESFPSTLRSGTSTTTALTSNANSSQMADAPRVAESLLTLQPPVSPFANNPAPSESPDISSKTSTMDDSSGRSSYFMPATVASGTDRSSFYSTGIDSTSISTTFSTPGPTPLGQPTNQGGMEMKPYSSTAEDYPNPMLHPNSAAHNGERSSSPQTATTPFKSIDSGIRSDDESASDAAVTESEPLVLRNKPIDRTSHISTASRTSFGLGLSDLSSDLMATFDTFKAY